MKAHVFATKIGGILTDNKFDRFVGGKTRGSLDFSSLSKISYSSKIFIQRQARKNKDYKVLVLADASGSMGGSPARNTGKALEMLNEALSHTDVEYALWSFAGDILCLKDFKDKKKKEGDVASLYHKHLNDRLLYYCDDCRTAFGSFSRSSDLCPSCNKETASNAYSSSYNADGLAVHLAMEAMKELSGEHILIVLSDGQADAIPYRDSLAYMQKDGVQYQKMRIDNVVKKLLSTTKTILCSIGIESNDVLKHYPEQNTIVVKSSDAVGEALIKLISKHIKRG